MRRTLALATACLAGIVLGAGQEPDSRPLVVRGRIALSLAGARAVIAGAEARAVALGVKENIAVVDEGGHLLAFVRMDGARPASASTAITKAESAATMRQATGPVTSGGRPPDPLLNLSLQNAAEASGGKITTLKGGVPIKVDGQIIGAIGVGGATGEQDAQVAEAGAERLIADLARVAPSPPR